MNLNKFHIFLMVNRLLLDENGCSSKKSNNNNNNFKVLVLNLHSSQNPK